MKKEKLKLKIKNYYFLLVVFTFHFSLFTFTSAQQPVSTFQLPPGEPITYASLSAGLDLTAKFLYGAGVTLGVITLVISGIMFFWAKSDAEAKKGKAWFKNGITGAFIILAVGVIIKTIQTIVEGRFFGP